MEIGNKDPKKEIPSKEMRRKMIGVNLSVGTFCGVWDADGVKQYLPDSPTIPLIAYDGSKGNMGIMKNHSDLIAVQTLRADSLFVSRKPGHDSSVLIPDPDLVSIPLPFIKKDSYIVLLVPIYDSFHPENGITFYDTTVLKCIDDQQLLKLMSIGERSFRERWNQFRPDKEKLQVPKELSDRYCELVNINVANSNESGFVNIWMGDKATKRVFDAEGKVVVGEDDFHYKRTVNGTICYRMVEGKAEKEKSKYMKKSLKLVPQRANTGMF